MPRQAHSREAAAALPQNCCGKGIEQGTAALRHRSKDRLRLDGDADRADCYGTSRPRTKGADETSRR